MKIGPAHTSRWTGVRRAPNSCPIEANEVSKPDQVKQRLVAVLATAWQRKADGYSAPGLQAGTLDGDSSLLHPGEPPISQQKHVVGLDRGRRPGVGRHSRI